VARRVRPRAACEESEERLLQQDHDDVPCVSIAQETVDLAPTAYRSGADAVIHETGEIGLPEHLSCTVWLWLTTPLWA
jgi:hypothetical protein